MKENNNQRPKRGFVSHSVCDLGQWENNQRKAYKTNIPDQERIKLLNEIGFQCILIEKRGRLKEKENNSTKNEQNDNDENFTMEKKKRRTKQYLIDHLKEQVNILSKEIEQLKEKQEKDKNIRHCNNIIKNPLKYKK